MGFWWGNQVGWQRIFLTDLTDGFLVGEMGWLAADFFNGFNGWVFGGTINNLLGVKKLCLNN